MWEKLQIEAREVAWLLSIVGGLSLVGIGLAIALAAALIG
jgi:hypothetical protein